jgi:hypothetical protein
MVCAYGASLVTGIASWVILAPFPDEGDRSGRAEEGQGRVPNLYDPSEKEADYALFTRHPLGVRLQVGPQRTEYVGHQVDACRAVIDAAYAPGVESTVGVVQGNGIQERGEVGPSAVRLDAKDPEHALGVSPSIDGRSFFRY